MALPRNTTPKDDRHTLEHVLNNVLRLSADDGLISLVLEWRIQSVNEFLSVPDAFSSCPERQRVDDSFASSRWQ